LAGCVEYVSRVSVNAASFVMCSCETRTHLESFCHLPRQILKVAAQDRVEISILDYITQNP
jgi:hypothetical protein